MIDVPADFAANRLQRTGGSDGQWIAALPQQVAELCERWELVPTGEPPWYGDNNLVVAVSRGEERAVLKLCSPDHDQDTEVAALRAWAGHGAVALLEVSAGPRALLLERLDGSRTLADLDLFPAAELAGALIRRLAVPAPAGLGTLGALVADFAATARSRNAALGDPVPRARIDAAIGLAADLTPGIGNALMHGDLHYGNVLAGRREPWLAIDPRPVAGDPEFAVPELMWTRADDAPDDATIRRLLMTVVTAGGLAADRALGWVRVRVVDYWLWGLANGLTIDPVRCRRVLDALD